MLKDYYYKRKKMEQKKKFAYKMLKCNADKITLEIGNLLLQNQTDKPEENLKIDLISDFPLFFNNKYFSTDNSVVQWQILDGIELFSIDDGKIIYRITNSSIEIKDIMHAAKVFDIPSIGCYLVDEDDKLVQNCDKIKVLFDKHRIGQQSVLNLITKSKCIILARNGYEFILEPFTITKLGVITTAVDFNRHPLVKEVHLEINKKFIKI